MTICSFKSTKNINGAIPVGAAYKVEWVPIKDPMATNQKTKQQGKQLGASIFSGGEGIICTNNANAQSEIFFTCKSGGPAKLGQMWKYSPSTGSISLFYESTSSKDFWNGDNINITPWGDLIICEDNKSNASNKSNKDDNKGSKSNKSNGKKSAKVDINVGVETSGADKVEVESEFKRSYPRLHLKTL